MFDLKTKIVLMFTKNRNLEQIAKTLDVTYRFVHRVLTEAGAFDRFVRASKVQVIRFLCWAFRQWRDVARIAAEIKWSYAKTHRSLCDLALIGKWERR